MYIFYFHIIGSNNNSSVTYENNYGSDVEQDQHKIFMSIGLK